MPETFDIWKLLAGLGIFLFGMFLMEEAVKNLAGRSFKKFIRTSTTGRIRSIVSGASVTAILQSSSAVSLMVLAFVGAGIMAMDNAIGVILGSNIGTTVTAWIVAYFGFKIDIEAFSLPLIGIGGLGLIFLGKSERYSNLSRLLVGFGFLFMGLDYMKQSVTELTETFDMASLPDYGIVVYALVGLLLTATMQSSSATIAIVLTALNAQVIGFHMAAAMVVGANVGTTTTVILGAIGGSQIKKRVALSHLTFNLISAIIGLAMLPVLVWVITLIIGSPTENAVMGVALYHTLFNVIGVLVFVPFIGLFAKLLIKAYPDKVTQVTEYLQNASPNISDAAIAGIQNEIAHLIRETIEYNLKTLRIDVSLVLSGQRHSEKLSLEDHYEKLNLLQAEIFSFAATMLSSEMDKEETALVNRQLHAARMALHSAKSIKDVRHNFDDFDASESSFVTQTNAEFRKRLIELYLKLSGLLGETRHAEIASKLDKSLKHLTKEDERFVRSIAEQTSKGALQDMEISHLLLVNRAFIQSSRQLILAIKEMTLNDEELEIFDRLTEQSNSSAHEE
ncbi:MAG: Na/Pi symporter [Flavobacteriales bacterium]|nr:Na/Pi symporter [Flavobacteriales bacterium]MCB9192134.1 Na/Pi symporter [Flavobacteriales bacterium]MCB9203817.1 Na/Pi symporter [Flavobacteriales bacterium]